MIHCAAVAMLSWLSFREDSLARTESSLNAIVSSSRIAVKLSGARRTAGEEVVPGAESESLGSTGEDAKKACRIRPSRVGASYVADATQMTQPERAALNRTLLSRSRIRYPTGAPTRCKTRCVDAPGLNVQPVTNRKTDANAGCKLEMRSGLAT